MRKWIEMGTDLNYSMQIEECSSRYMPSVLDGNSVIHSDTNSLPKCVENTFAYELVCLNVC